MEKQNTDPVVACEKIKYGTGQRFSCYDRQEEEMNLDNVNYLSKIGEIYEKVCLGGIEEGEDAEN
jgi:CII-binding regulator of phage lambda lysogenization HflD